MISIRAHSAKIYGIDWAHNSSRELITCSLDKTIKIWDIHAPVASDTGARARHPSETPQLAPYSAVHEPRTVINTSYPIWRARDLPFGKGVLSLPQRGSNTLEMWRTSPEDPELEYPVKDFDGHSDVVKEFVWRRGGRGVQYAVVEPLLTDREQTGATSSLSHGPRTRRCVFGLSMRAIWVCVSKLRLL
jgi:WD40 repeat protein